MRDALTGTLEKRVHLSSTRTKVVATGGLGLAAACYLARLLAQSLDFAALHFDFGSRLILPE